MGFESLAHWKRNTRAKADTRGRGTIVSNLQLMEVYSLLIRRPKGNLQERVGIALTMIPERPARVVC
jgi:hypothetical protein